MTEPRDMVCGHTKYEGCPPCPCGRAVLDAWFAGQLIERATIDYEAAAEALWTWPAGQSEPSPAMKARYAKDARRAVDAAVGEETP